jgi:hypothetical protein
MISHPLQQTEISERGGFDVAGSGLAPSSGRGLRISPFSVDWLVEPQGLRRPFGRPDGMKRNRQDNNEGI